MVDNNTYNLLKALSENLEACETYKKYAKDGNPQLWQKLIQTTEDNARILHQELAKAMSSQGQGQSQSQSQRSGQQGYYAQQGGNQP